MKNIISFETDNGTINITEINSVTFEKKNEIIYMNAELVADDGNKYKLTSTNVNIKEIKMDETDIKKIENGEVTNFVANRN